MWSEVLSSSTNATLCKRNFYSEFSVGFQVPVWSSCSFHCKTELELVPPHIYVWSVVCNCIDTLCSQQASWRTAFTHNCLSELSMWIDVRSSSTKGTGSRKNFFSGFSVSFQMPVWNSCSFHCKTVLERVPPHIYMYGVQFAIEKKSCVPNKQCEGQHSHTLISQNWACGETFVHLAQMNGLHEKLILWFLSVFPNAG